MSGDSVLVMSFAFVVVGVAWAIAFTIWAMAKYQYNFSIEMKDD